MVNITQQQICSQIRFFHLKMTFSQFLCRSPFEAGKCEGPGYFLNHYVLKTMFFIEERFFTHWCNLFCCLICAFVFVFKCLLRELYLLRLTQTNQKKKKTDFDYCFLHKIKVQHIYGGVSARWGGKIAEKVDLMFLLSTMNVRKQESLWLHNFSRILFSILMVSGCNLLKSLWLLPNFNLTQPKLLNQPDDLGFW